MRPFARTVLYLVAASALAACSSSEGTAGGVSMGMSGGSTGASGVSWTRISAQDLDAKMSSGEVELINVHVPYEGEIPGTDAFIPYDDVDAVQQAVESASSPVVIYCRSGNMSTQVAQELADRGVTGFEELDGGFYAWQEAGLPFTVN